MELRSIQTQSVFDRFDSLHDGGGSFVVTPDWGGFTAADMFSVGDGDNDQICLIGGAAGGPKRFIERPALFECVENEMRVQTV